MTRALVLLLLIVPAAEGQPVTGPGYEAIAEKVVELQLWDSTHLVDLDECCSARADYTRRVIATNVRHDTSYALLAVAGRSRNNDGSGYCGAGIEKSLVWLRLVRSKGVDSSAAVAIHSCVKNIYRKLRETGDTIAVVSTFGRLDSLYILCLRDRLDLGLQRGPSGQAPHVAIRECAFPSEVRKVLDRDMPGWAHCPVHALVDTIFWHAFPGLSPNLVRGDFDGDSKMDYAVRIARRSPQGASGVVVALMARGSSYEAIVVGPAFDFISVNRKGTLDQDHERGTEFVHATDAIAACIGEKAGVSYIYSERGFMKVATSD